ncbi:hypothetical protein [uncultured Serinicoccus sp.]|uniref:hypothetical protein n=1 Tax=uncultured Serinicoccus sp. TaxID=735514 RepID=UPI002613570E|nr:hypothetical protein [uncultured Serinicoccus sp.]
MQTEQLSSQSDFYWKVAYWGVEFDYGLNLPFGQAVIAANRWTCIIGTSRRTAEAMDSDDDDVIWSVIDGVGEDGNHVAVALPCGPGEDVDRAAVADHVSRLRERLARTTARLIREQAVLDREDPDSTDYVSPYRWARVELDPAQPWYRARAQDAVRAVLRTNSAEAELSSSRHSRLMKVNVELLGFPVVLRIARYFVPDRVLRVYAPALVDYARAVASRHNLDVQQIRVLDRSNPHGQIFFWDVDTVLARERARSGRRVPVGLAEALPPDVVEVLATSWSTYDRLGVPPEVERRLDGLERRSLVDTPSSECLVCGGNPDGGVCRACDDDVVTGLPVGHGRDWEPSMHWAMTQLAIEFGGAMSMRQVNRPVDLSEADAPRRLVLRMLAKQGEKPWTERLVDSGVAADGHRASWGLVSRAVDGHLCRSALERTVDDWMHVNGVAHVPEPMYPRDAELNARGLLRADWALIDGTLVEAFGALGVEEYAVKAARKRELVRRHGLRLIELTDKDTARLDVIFKRWVRKLGLSSAD